MMVFGFDYVHRVVACIFDKCHCVRWCILFADVIPLIFCCRRRFPPHTKRTICEPIQMKLCVATSLHTQREKKMKGNKVNIFLFSSLDSRLFRQFHLGFLILHTYIHLLPNSFLGQTNLHFLNFYTYSVVYLFKYCYPTDEN